MNPANRFIVVGLHPSIDRTLEIPRFAAGGVIRARVVMVEAAGKGVNVAHSLSNFGHPVSATGFIARRDEKLFLSSFGAPRSGGRVRTDFVRVEGATRENVTIIERDAQRDTHILAGELRVRPADVARLRKIIAREVAAGDWAVFSGSRPGGMRIPDYARLLALCSENGAKLCVDARGPMLRAALQRKPWLIKPNLDELAEWTGRRPSGIPETLQAARPLLARCEHLLISLGPDGALLVSRAGAWRARETRRAAVLHTVGCGDALLAGFLSACAAGKPPPEATRFAVACGSACVRSYRACLRSPAEALRFVPRVKLTEL
jgi:1-phosphofructokinase family hexose kinase